MPQALYGNENRISELPRLHQYNMTNREQWDLHGSVNLHADKYPQSVYGLKEASGWSLNLDASYQASEDFSISVFYTYEDQHTKSAGNTYTPNSNATNVGGFTTVSGGCYADIATRNLNNKIDPCNNWSADLHDQIDSLGISFRRTGLMGGKLELRGDLSATQAVTDSSFGGGNYVNNPLAVTGAPVGTVAAYYIPAVSLPSVTARSVDLHLVADYALGKSSTLRLGYLYSNLVTQDWAYQGIQAGGLTQMLPSFEQSTNYIVQAAAITYVLRF